MSTLSERILQRIEKHRQQSMATQKQLDKEMKLELDNHERFRLAANRVLAEIIQPRMEELAHHFENASLMAPASNQETSCVISFAHSLQFPATVSLLFALLPCEVSTEFTVHYDLEILPVFMEYRKNDSLQVPFVGADESIAQWVDDRLLDFLDTYLKVETHPLYQKDNLVLDPVCGMRIPVIAAACKTEFSGITIHFCSEHCREEYLRNRTLQ